MRIRDMLKPGAVFYLQDVVFSFQPANYQAEIEQWIATYSEKEESFSRLDFEVHIRDEYSTYAGVLEGLLEAAGFQIECQKIWSPMYAGYLCTRSSS